LLFYFLNFEGTAKMEGILLAGGAEFQGRMTEPDRQAIALASRGDIKVCIIPTAAVPDNNHERAGNNGVRWFQSLGVKNACSLPIIDIESANDRHLSEILTHADLIYLLGGFPGYLEKTLRSSRCWSTMCEAYRRGAILAGSSAGAMVLCEWFLNPESREIQPGLGLLPDMVVIPHHETVGNEWIDMIHAQMPDVLIAGIDEQTGMLQKQGSGRWNVYGKGSVTVYQDQKRQTYSAGIAGFKIP
jgi:cyanophycinase